MFSYLSPETRVRKDHPLRAIRSMVDEVLAQLSGQFDGMYASAGQPSIPPEKRLRAQLLQMLYSIRSERLLMEEIDYNMLFRWFVGLSLDEEVWDATTFTKNRSGAGGESCVMWPSFSPHPTAPIPPQQRSTTEARSLGSAGSTSAAHAVLWENEKYSAHRSRQL
jgi:hypothetical protein